MARSDSEAAAASLGLLAYGIPYEIVLVSSSGVTLPTFNDTATHGNYGGIMIMDALSFEYSTGWASAVTTEQWTVIHGYQTDFNVRMVRINEWPGVDFGVTTVASSCCGDGVEQSVYFSDVSDFATANLKVNAEMSTTGLYHVPATITDSATTKAVAMFGITTGFSAESVAAVINNFSGREQFVWFMSWAPDWSETSAFLQHAHIHWMTRGLFLGKRKVHLSCQIDDVQLATELYLPASTELKIVIEDLEAHAAWHTSLTSRLPAGSDFWLELGHNGNGDFIAVQELSAAEGVCYPENAVDYDEVADTELEYMKPLGTGEDRWPEDYEYYNWTSTCALLDDFADWFTVEANRDAFAHVSHTFTHLELNNATYHDAAREIQFNQEWMEQVGIDKAARFSPNGIIPPAITGLHNGDVIEAWMANGITHVVGDNTRSVLRNTGHVYWPLISNVADNGYDGLTIVPRFSLAIYYNCATAECCAAEWAAISAGTGVFDDLMEISRTTNVRNLLALMADPYMFHQANMHQTDVEERTVGEYTAKMSLVMYWTETIAQEIARLTDWPIVSLKHDDIAAYFLARKALDECNPKLSYAFSDDGKSIASVTVTADGNTCSAKIPVTIPSGSSTASGGSVTNDVVGQEPPIQWVTLSGEPVTLTLSSPIAF
ncbi:hypothetical protein B0J13DRAFT_477347 [Dactylonectria estremocensis]|uniref:Extracellular serine-rich protein n=1 Tax=Dactylonectria estremocensis TaxID=1079267 RepID=A0A9P9EMM9_9HYPO|nr:hypothetical protein B0J13DRAFT_477347 [Dactylonectria estremocensis]